VQGRVPEVKHIEQGGCQGLNAEVRGGGRKRWRILAKGQWGIPILVAGRGVSCGSLAANESEVESPKITKGEPGDLTKRDAGDGSMANQTVDDGANKRFWEGTMIEM